MKRTVLWKTHPSQLSKRDEFSWNHEPLVTEKLKFRRNNWISFPDFAKFYYKSWELSFMFWGKCFSEICFFVKKKIGLFMANSWLRLNVSYYDPLDSIVRTLIGWQEVTNQKQVFIKCFQPHFKINILTWCALGTRASEHHYFQRVLTSSDFFGQGHLKFTDGHFGQ